MPRGGTWRGIRPLFSLDPRREALNPRPSLSKYLRQARSAHSLHQNSPERGGSDWVALSISSLRYLSWTSGILKRDLHTSKTRECVWCSTRADVSADTCFLHAFTLKHSQNTKSDSFCWFKLGMKDWIIIYFVSLFYFSNHTPDCPRYDRTERLWLFARRENV